MKNKILCLIALVMVVLALLCSCGKPIENNDGARLKLLYRDITDVGMLIYVDVETRVQYIVTMDGGVCPMVDENGNILLYEGELE